MAANGVVTSSCAKEQRGEASGTFHALGWWISLRGLFVFLRKAKCEYSGAFCIGNIDFQTQFDTAVPWKDHEMVSAICI